MPNRVQLQRVKGWRMPANTRKVDRTTVFGNPFDSVKHDTSDAVRNHRLWLTGALTNEQLLAQYPDIVAKHLIARRRRVLESLAQLRGMNLACWCSPARPCHADLLLKLANENESNKTEAPRRHSGINPNGVRNLITASE
jgi:hypothetical protein